MSSLVDVNLFSLHNMYANRLIRAYLGASRRKKAWENRWLTGIRPIDRCGAPTNSGGEDREENPISGFDFDDDIPLLELRTGRRSDDLNLPAYWGPLPLINTALNLVATRELDWQERQAESFVLSPLYCGSESTGYQPLPDDFRRGNMTLGRAVAVSGAAADPNMGHHTSTAVTALMTVFNTRLGWWIENPSRPLRRWETADVGAVGGREPVVRRPDSQGADRPDRLGRPLGPPLRRRPLREPRRLRADPPALPLHRRSATAAATRTSNSKTSPT